MIKLVNSIDLLLWFNFVIVKWWVFLLKMFVNLLLVSDVVVKVLFNRVVIFFCIMVRDIFCYFLISLGGDFV